jgi:sulfate adenylyltransferase
MAQKCKISDETFQDCINLCVGLFSPLRGFMDERDYRSVIEDFCTHDGLPWTIPITLPVPEKLFKDTQPGDVIYLFQDNFEVGRVNIESKFYLENPKRDLELIYKTTDTVHPGVQRDLSESRFKVSGPVIIYDRHIPPDTLSPQNTQAYFRRQGWKTIAGFQTRNPIHKAHEHLQRTALELCDALLINPLVGWKKIGDFSEAAVDEGYKAMIEHYYCNLNVHYELLRTPMRYAGPREAIFHSIIRRNLGCTHFIIGRDHAGVGGYYGKYEAHELARVLTSKFDLGIQVLLLKEPFLCNRCGQIVSDSTCAHDDTLTEKISGTLIRELLSKDKRPPEKYMREEVSDAIIGLGKNKFIKEN